MNRPLTEYKYYMQQMERHPDTVILMRVYDAYYILGANARLMLPLIEKLLTHKDAGKMFCWMEKAYGYESLSFGKHNLDKVLSEIIRTGRRVAIIDFIVYWNENGGREWEMQVLEKQLADHYAEERKKKLRKPVQLELEFEW